MTVATLNPNADTRLQSGSPTTNDNSAWINVGESNAATSTHRTLIKFDLSSIPSTAVVSSVVLRLYCVTDYSSNARVFSVYRTKRAWVEIQSTWNVWSTGNNWSTAGGFHADDCEQTEIGNRSMTATETVNQYKEFTLDAAKVQEMINGTFANNGFLIKAATESDDMYSFNSRESASNLPELVITYVNDPAGSPIWFM